VGKTIEVELPRTSFFTGDVVEGTLVVETTKEVNSRGIYLDFLGRERTQITRSAGKTTVTYTSHNDFAVWRMNLQGAGSIPPGTYRFPFKFQIPQAGLPSYTGRNAWVTYALEARLDVPLWLDAVWKGGLYVFYERSSVRTFSQPVRFQSGDTGPQGPQVYVELDGDRFFARELIGCRITLLRLGEHRIRHLYARLTGGEFARAQSTTETSTTYKNEVDIPMENIQVGVPFTFEIPIPAEVQSAYRGMYSYYNYLLTIGLDISWASNLEATTPVVIVR
jgi:Arrestin (or S-antigen), N-terminal domain